MGGPAADSGLPSTGLPFFLYVRCFLYLGDLFGATRYHFTSGTTRSVSSNNISQRLCPSLELLISLDAVVSFKLSLHSMRDV